MSITHMAETILGTPGCNITHSKGQYQWDNPTNIVIFNSNVYSVAGEGDSPEKIWWGDLDLTLQEGLINLLAQSVGTTIYVLYEADGRWENAATPVLSNYVYRTDGVHPQVNPRDTWSRTTGGQLIRPERTPPEAPAINYCREQYEQVLALVDYPSHPEYDQDCTLEEPLLLDVRSLFDGVSRVISPVHRYYEVLERNYGIPQESALRLYLSGDDYEELERLVTLWVEAYHPYLTEYKIQVEVAVYLGCYGPNSFSRADSASQEWIQSGYVYRRLEEGETSALPGSK